MRWPNLYICARLSEKKLNYEENNLGYVDCCFINQQFCAE